MIERTLKTTRGALSVTIPSQLKEVTLGQMMQLQDKTELSDLDAISILSGIAIDELKDVSNFHDFDVFGEAVLSLSNQIKLLYKYDEIPSKVTFKIDGKSVKVNVIRNLSVEPAIHGGIFLGYSWDGLNSPPAYAQIDAGATMVITSQQQNVQLGQTVQCERIFPDISQKDLLKDSLQRFGIICQTDNANRTISFNSFHDIVSNIPIAKNWTGKCLDHGKTVNFQLGGYAQVNNLKYKDDDAILPKGFADSYIKVADTTLPAETDLFESQFAPTLNRSYLGGNASQIKMIDSESDSDDFSISVSPRILIDQKLELRNKAVKFTDGATTITVNDIISIPYFYKPDAPALTPDYGPASLKFEDLRKSIIPSLKKYYSKLKKWYAIFYLPRAIYLNLTF
jgi:hypothetical protein